MPLDSVARVTILDIAVRLHCASPALTKEAEAVLKTAEAFANFAEVEAAPATKSRKPKPDAAPAAPLAETAAEAPAAPVEEKPQTPAPAATKPAAAAVEATEAEVKAAVGKVATTALAGGAPKAREILGKYGASNISTLKPENYAKALADLNAALKAAEDAAAVAA